MGFDEMASGNDSGATTFLKPDETHSHEAPVQLVVNDPGCALLLLCIHHKVLSGLHLNDWKCSTALLRSCGVA